MLPKAGSIYVKCLAITVVSCGILAAIVSYVGDRASQEIARTAVAAMAKDQTSVAAHQLFGPVRFRKTEDVQGVLATAFGTNDLVRSVVVVDSEGALLATQSIEDAADAPAPLTDLAREAASSAAPVVADDGLTLAFPVTGPGGQSVVGAITASWTTRPFLATIAEYRVTQFTKAALTLIVLLGLGALAIRTLISRPMTRIGARAAAMANGDLHSETPEISSSSEVGDLARSIDALRVKLLSGESARIDARFQSAGFKASSAAMVMCDPELKITYANGAFEELLRENLGFFRSNQADLKAHEIIGTKVDRLLGGAGVTQEKMAMADFPYSEDFPAGERVLGISVLPIRDEDGACEGYVIEWEDTTERRKRDAILAALEEGQLRADFDGAGRMTSASMRFVDATGVSTREISTISLDSLLGADHDEASQKVNNGAPFFGRFALQHGSCRLTLDGSINPIRNRAEEITGFVLLGSDVTEEVARLEEASARNDQMMAAQAHAAAELRSAMAALSKGDLKVRIDSEFEGDYDCVRIDFNAAIAALDTAIGEILAGAHTIRDEVAHVSEAADAFSRRTEQQAATLEETAAAISELTASVESAAQGARRANEVVKQAREDAEASGGVVQETVNAMGEIERSSEQISRIIGVIDEIAFQTNLLALNAGVEAARAGDAGRGFAVVASEVRALAQRSSEAAKEISDLISASGDHVKKGVTLVDKAGSVLTGIARTIGEVADHVSEIASSAREQATGVGEINTAMGQLEQVTQKNVAMFEETMAASQALNDQAGALVDVTGRFECSTIRPKPSSGTFATAPFQTARSEPTKPTAAPTHGSGTAMSSGRADVDSLEISTAERSSPAAVGNLALKSDDEDWEEF